VRACWAALWTTNARRYMANHGLNPSGTAMGVLIQPLVAADASGGGLSETAEGNMLISATWGLGSAIAQGQVVPDRVVLSRQGFVRTMQAGRKDHRDTCGHGQVAPQAVAAEDARKPCLTPGKATELGRMLRKCETLLQTPVEIEWALDDVGFKLLQARPLHMQPAHVPDEIWLKHPGLNGHPAGIGWGSGRAVIVNCECELTRVAPGDVLVTRVAGPALSPRSPASAVSRWFWACLTPPAASRTARRSQSTASPASCDGSPDAQKKSQAAHFCDAAGGRERAAAAAQGRDRHGEPGCEPHHRQTCADRRRAPLRHSFLPPARSY
jgi:phosphoenolpyruvate synthase/pyruvate phosphate dikinase